MSNRLPVIPTVVVLLAVATMIGLGFWQLGRLQEKEALIARYEAALDSEAMIPFPTGGTGEGQLFRTSSVDCARVVAINPTAGRSADGESGWAQRVTCANDRTDATLTVDIGWTRAPQPVEWSGGTVQGVIAPGPRLVATEAVMAGVRPLAAPDPSDLPNNHLAYAWQWFFFALTALVIYVLALRRRWRASGE